MKFYLSLLLSGFLLTTLHSAAYAQGCSDAGACTMASFQPHSAEHYERKTQLSIGSTFGSADNSISTLSNSLTLSHRLTETLGFETKLTAITQSGNDISEFGFSDIYATASYRVSDQVMLTLGTKIPLSDGNAKKDGLPLPMDYQSSLGTFDLIVGFGFSVEKLQVALALQQPLSQNSNEFLAENYPLGSKLREFQSTNNYERQGDVILRLSYPFALNEALKLTPSLLPVYHLSNDTYTDAQGKEKDIDGSQGLTLNGNVFLDYELNPGNTLRFNAALPLIIRDERPDGLTRGFVLAVEYKILL